MKYLLDTDHISFLQIGIGPEYGAIRSRMAPYSAMDLGFSIISFHEQTLGGHAFINRARTPAEVVRGYRLLTEIFRGFSAATVVSFDSAAALRFEDLRSRKIRLATMDLRIASIALARGLILLTRNTRDFIQVPGLTTEDWTL